MDEAIRKLEREFAANPSLVVAERFVRFKLRTQTVPSTPESVESILAKLKTSYTEDDYPSRSEYHMNSAVEQHKLENVKDIPQFLRFIRDRSHDAACALSWLSETVSLEQLKRIALRNLQDKLDQANFEQTLNMMSHSIEIDTYDEEWEALDMFCQVYDPTSLNTVPGSWDT